MFRPALLPMLLLVTIPWAHALSDDEFAVCVDALGDKARAAGIDNNVIREATTGLNLQERVLELDRRQPEFLQTFWQYLDIRVSANRIRNGRAMLDKHRSLLNRVHREFGVPPAYLVALWGLETNFGSYFGNMPVLDSLATLACDPRRSEFFTSEFIEALKIVQGGHIKLTAMEGSWAGAMGHTQFMPSTFNAYAVDYDGNGRIDLWNSLADAFASSAHYLRSMGWNSGQRWGREVRVPDDFGWELAGLETRKHLREWAELGIRRADGGELPIADMEASLLLPAGYRGPAFLVYDNFRVIMRWNTSISYAIAVGHLADRIAGRGELQAQPPTQEVALSREQVKEMQRLLNELGYDSGKPDGIAGRMTRRAVRHYQMAAGLPADGHPDPALLGNLRSRARD